MAGISRNKWIWVLAALLPVVSCQKEREMEPAVPQEERFAEFDPVIRFGLETYMGAEEPETKTTYAGDDQTYLVNSLRYERINWNVKEPTSPTDPPVDVVQIKSEKDFTKRAGQNTADYKAVEISGHTNQTGNKDDEADTAPTSGDAKDNFYWSAEKEDRYFYAVYPSPNVTGATLANFSIDASHTATVEGEMPAIQPHYISVKVNGTPATPGSPASIEYMPDMTNAYMYAAAKMPGADAGYKKVPLRFKPLFSAVKLHVTARDAGMQKYRLKKVELRTDLHYNDVYLRPGNSKGTALGGKFKAKFKADGSGSTEDFTLVGNPSDICKRLTINILEGDRKVLNEDTLKLTFLALPIDQKYMTVDYTFECLVDDSLDPNNPANWPAEGTADRDKKVKTIRRFLTLQNRNKIFKDDDGWYTLPPARKLYIRSGVPAIEYYFEVDAQSFFPRTSTTAMVNTSYHEAQNFYSVESYRDSSGVKQPLRWKVTGYGSSASGPFDTNAPHWLTLRGDDGDWADVSDEPDLNGNPSWGNPWGQGTRFDDADKVKDGVSFHSRGYSGFKDGLSYVYYDAGAKDNSSPKFTWTPAAHFSYKDPDGNYYYPANYPDPARVGEAYAYDLSHHDIYGNLLVSKNGEKGTPPYTTANCYVVSAPGWYRFPAVYGNGFKDGNPNEDAWKCDGGTYRLGAFKDHANQDITDPWITRKYTIDNVEILWQDADDLANAKGFIATDPNRAEKQKPFFWKDPDTGYGYIYFYVNQVASANAVIAAKSGNTIVWSWHIWGVPEPNSTLEKVTVEKSNYAYNSNPNIKNEFKYKNPVNAVVWKRVDLGQGSKEDSAPYRYCYVKFSQYWRGKEIATRIVCFVQSGVEDSSGLWDAPTYQWGRKDPFRGSQTGRYTPYYDGSDKSLGYAIQNPTFLLYASSNASWHGNTRYDNLWNTNVDYYPQTFDGFVVDGTSMGRKNTPVKKTVYDPCPPGFCVPNLFAFTGFNTQGLLQVKIPHGNGNLEKVTNHRDWTDQRPVDSGFIDEKFTSSFTGYEGWPYFAFLAQNDDNVSWRRKIAGEEVFFYARGRRNGGDVSTAGNMDQNQALSSGGSPISGNYWLAEPACSNSSLWSYGSAFIFSNNTSGTGAWVYPVAGASGGQAKWQRTHGCYIRPMEEQ